MKDAKRIFGLSLLIAGAVISLTINAQAQDFREREDLWKTEMIRAKGVDTVKLEKHSFMTLPALSDTAVLVYHEPMPDSVMPKTAIEVGFVTIQAGSAEDVIDMLEKQARRVGADWIVSFNEPRLKFNSAHEVYYRSTAMLYKVINPELIPQDQIAEVNCDESHLKSYSAVQDYVKHIVAKSGE
jgi:hypothetical protein